MSPNKLLKSETGTFYWIFIIATCMMLAPTNIQNSFSVVFENNPFYSMSNAKIDRIKGYTSDGNLFVELEIHARYIKKRGTYIF